MKVKSLSVTLVLLLLLVSLTSQADMWDKERKSSFGKVKSDATWDETKFQYKGGIDFDPQSPEALEIKYDYNLGMGCDGFGITANLYNDITGEALLDYVQGIGMNILSATPELLLAYAMPTVYDKLKEFKSHSAKLLSMKFKSCEEIQNAVLKSDWMKERQESVRGEKLRYDAAEGRFLAESLKDSKEAGPGDCYDVKDAASCSPIKDGIAWLKEEHKCEERCLEDLDTPEKERCGLVELVGDYTVSGEGEDMNVKTYPPTKTAHDLKAKNNKEARKNLEKALENYEKDGKVSDNDLEKLCGASLPISPDIIRSLAAMAPNDKASAMSNVVSEISFNKTLWELDYLIGKTQMLAEKQQKDRVQIQGKVDILKSQRQAMIEEKEFAVRSQELIAGSTIDKTEEDKARALRRAQEAGEVERRKGPRRMGSFF